MPQVGDEDYHEEYSVLLGFEFARTFKVERKISVTFETDSDNKHVIVEQGMR